MHNYELARMNLQLFGEDENEAIERITDIIIQETVRHFLMEWDRKI